MGKVLLSFGVPSGDDGAKGEDGAIGEGRGEVTLKVRQARTEEEDMMEARLMRLLFDSKVDSLSCEFDDGDLGMAGGASTAFVPRSGCIALFVTFTGECSGSKSSADSRINV